MSGASWAGDQDAFRGRDDDVAINSTTFNGGGGLNANWTQDVDQNFRCRFVIQETAGGKQNNQLLELWYSLNGGAYAEMTASTPVQPADTTQYTNGATTTQVIGSGTYVTGDALAGVDNATDTGNIDYAGNDECEAEWCLTIDSAQVSDGDTIALRVYVAGGTALGSYTNTPTVTANVPAPTLVVNDFFSTTQMDAPALVQNFNMTVADFFSTTQIDSPALLEITGTADVLDMRAIQRMDEPTLATVISLTVNDFFSTTQMDNILLVQQHNISVADFFSTTQMDNLVLDLGSVNLVVADFFSTTQMDNILLVQQHNISVADFFSTTQMDNLVLNTEATLTIADFFSTTQMDNVDLTQLHIIVVQNLFSTTQMDSFAITQTHNIAVADFFSTTQMDDAGSLPQVHNIAVADMYSTTQIDSFAVTQTHILVIADMYSTTQMDDGFDLVQTQFLIVQDMYSETYMNDPFRVIFGTVGIRDNTFDSVDIYDYPLKHRVSVSDSSGGFPSVTPFDDGFDSGFEGNDG